MAILVAAPVLLSVVARITSSTGMAVLRIDGERVGSAGMFAAMIGILYLKFSVPALGVFYGTSLIADEVEDKTITYLFTRPIPRRSIVMGKYVAYLVCAASVVLPSVMIVFLLMVPFRDMASGFGPVLRNLGVVALGLAAYGALFLLAGVMLKRPLVAGLVRVWLGTDCVGDARLPEAHHDCLLPAARCAGDALREPLVAASKPSCRTAVDGREPVLALICHRDHSHPVDAGMEHRHSLEQ
jgi:hypothetical protein